MFLTVLNPPYPHHPPQRAKMKKMRKFLFWLFVQFKASKLLWDLPRTILTCFWPPPPLTRPQKAKIKKIFFFVWKKFWLNFSKVQYFFLWVDTWNTNIVAESSMSLVSKTTLKIFFGQVFKSHRSGFQKMRWKPDQGDMKTWQVVLDTRHIKDSTTIFGFAVSTHKKSTELLKKLRPKLDQFGGSLGLKPLCTQSLPLQLGSF